MQSLKRNVTYNLNFDEFLQSQYRRTLILVICSTACYLSNNNGTPTQQTLAKAIMDSGII